VVLMPMLLSFEVRAPEGSMAAAADAAMEKKNSEEGHNATATESSSSVVFENKREVALSELHRCHRTLRAKQHSARNVVARARGWSARVSRLTWTLSFRDYSRKHLKDVTVSIDLQLLL
jgi:hypothetical protein